MADTVRMFIVLLTQSINDERVCDAIARALALPFESVMLFSNAHAGWSGATVELFPADGDVRLQIHVHVSLPNHNVPQKDVEFAPRLALIIRGEVVCSSPTEEDIDALNPYLWLLVRPDGSVFRIAQFRLDQGDDKIYLDRSTATPYSS